MEKDFIDITSIEKGCDTSTILAYRGIKKNYKVHKLILGVSSLFFLSNIDYSQFATEAFCEDTNCTYIPSSVCFPGESEGIIKPVSFGEKKIVAKAKIKKKYFISDEELEQRMNTDYPKEILPNEEESSIEDFVKYNSGRFINSLDKWL